MRKAYLASIVPVIINSILNEHQLVADIVAFVGKGDFPRSRLGEKQRGKILASWVTRKMRTIAQFSIRDPDAEDSEAMTAVPEDRAVDPSSLVPARGSFAPSIDRSASGAQHATLAQRFSGADDPNYAAEQNLPYESSIVESPPAPLNPGDNPNADDHSTPTGQIVSEYFPSSSSASTTTADDYLHTQSDFQLPQQGQHTAPQISPHNAMQPLTHGIDRDYFAVSPKDTSQHDPEATPIPGGSGNGAPVIREQGLYHTTSGGSGSQNGSDSAAAGGGRSQSLGGLGGFDGDTNYAHTPLYAKKSFIEPRRTAYADGGALGRGGRVASGGGNGADAGDGKYVAYHPSLTSEIKAPVTPELYADARIGVADGGEGREGGRGGLRVANPGESGSGEGRRF